MDERQIHLKIKNEVKKYEALKKSFLKLYESEQKASKGRLETISKLNKLEEIDNSQLKEIYDIFIAEMEELEKKRETHLQKISDFILPVTNCYPNKLKEPKEYLKNYEEAKKRKEKLEKNRNISQVQDINGDLAKSIREENAKGEDIQKGMMTFERARCNDNKKLFLHFIHSELKYHAAALENLTSLFSQINEKEPKESFEEFIDKYKIDIDLKELGIDIDEIKKKKDEREKKEKVQASEVHEDDFEEDNQSDKVKESKKKIANSNRTSEDEV